ncbi:hypothetical protein [Streptomyces sp. NPDC048419]|uniref:hypothetical protein n=1 Tax=Streptomyces sp. NPDC048419 TaxID=3365547 RepID=UPI00371BE6DF
MPGMDWLNKDFGKVEVPAAVCVALTTGAFCFVASLHPTEGGMGVGAGNAAVVTDHLGPPAAR